MLIHNVNKARQFADYSGLAFGNIYPTDVDGYIEYKNIACVLYELKYRDATMPKGQQIALERMVDNARTAGKDAVLFLCSHDAPEEDAIDVANAVVKQIYYCGKWHHADGETAKYWTEKFLRWSEKKQLGWMR